MIKESANSWGARSFMVSSMWSFFISWLKQQQAARSKIFSIYDTSSYFYCLFFFPVFLLHIGNQVKILCHWDCVVKPHRPPSFLTSFSRPNYENYLKTALILRFLPLIIHEKSIHVESKPLINYRYWYHLLEAYNRSPILHLMQVASQICCTKPSSNLLFSSHR